MIIKIIKKTTPTFVKNFLRRIHQFLTYDKWANQSYSQEGEDMVLKRIFEQKEKGFYVDIGAHHPKRYSNTYIFYKNGWRGINIDAMPESMKLFNKIRPRDTNLEIGIADKEGKLKYYIFNEKALNSFSEELAKKINTENNSYHIKKTINIDVKPLDKILDKYLGEQKIDFLNVDVEGFDLEVLKSNNWSKYRPKIILIEILNSSLDNINEHPIKKFMEKINYKIFAKQVNTVFFKDINND